MSANNATAKNSPDRPQSRTHNPNNKLAMMLEQDYRYILEPTTIGRGTFSQTQKATIAIGGKGAIAAGSRGAIVKTLAFHLRELPDFWRFKRHFSKLAHRLADCKHPHLARVIDCFEDDGQPYVAYEAIAGRSLTDILETKGALPLNLALRYIEQIASAIATLHDAGLLHLDINPSNIIQRPDKDEVVAIEFGLTAELTPAIKQTRANLLSPGYAAPEQHQPEAFCTPATDIYALCATLYALLNGNPPPPAPLLDIIECDRWQHFPSDLPESIKTAILQGLSVDPQQRPQSVEAWQSLLKGTVTAPSNRENLAAEPIDTVESNNGVTPSIIQAVPPSELLGETTIQEINLTEEVQGTEGENPLELVEILELESASVKEEVPVILVREKELAIQDLHRSDARQKVVEEPLPEVKKTTEEQIFAEGAIETAGASDLESLTIVEQVPPSELLGETAFQEFEFTEESAETEEDKNFDSAKNIELESLTVRQEIAVESANKETTIQDIHRADGFNTIVEDRIEAYENYDLTSFPVLEEVHPSEVLEETPLQSVNLDAASAAVEEESVALLENCDRLESLSGLEGFLVDNASEELEIKDLHHADNSLEIEEIAVESSENYPSDDFLVIEKVSPANRLEESSLQVPKADFAETEAKLEAISTDVAESQDLMSGTIEEEIPDAIATDEPEIQDLHRADGRYTEEKKVGSLASHDLTSLPTLEKISPSEEFEETALEPVNQAEARTTVEKEPVDAVESNDLGSFLLVDPQQLPELLEISSASLGNGKHALTREELQSTKMVLWWLSQTNAKPTPLKPKFPMRALLVTCAIAASAGAGLGISVRVNRPEEAGSSVWHLKQSFPPRDMGSPTIEEES